MKEQLILCLCIVFGMSSAFYAITPFQYPVAGCAVIEGRVIDETGRPVSGANVSSMITDRPPRGRLRSSLTDAQGQFTLMCAQPGSNRIYVSKEDQYYPDTFLSPLVDAKLIPIVNVAEQGVSKGVEVHLPPRGGRLVAQAIDATTQQPVEGAQLRICRADDLRKCLTINATFPDERFEKVVPSIRITVKVSAPGYEDWYYKEGNASKRAKLLLTPGTSKSMTILLRPRGKRSMKTKL